MNRADPSRTSPETTVEAGVESTDDADIGAPVRRTGRRPGDSRSREAILDAAHAHFQTHGYDGATIRGIAAEAGVDPALVYYFFKGKDELFTATMAYPLAPRDVISQVIEGGSVETLGERMVRFMVGLEPAEGGAAHPIVGILRSAFAHPNGSRMVREFVTRELFRHIAAQITLPDPQLRVTLAGSQLIGMVVARYVVKVEPLASADPEFLVACYAPTLQRYFTGDLPDPALFSPPAGR